MLETEDAIACRSVTGVKEGDLIEVEMALEQTEVGGDPLRQMALE
jgi:hypothetical protein